MLELLTLLWKHHLKRWDVAIVVLLGAAMILSLSLLLVEGSVLSTLANFDPMMRLIEQTSVNSSRDGLPLIKGYLTLTGFLLFQFVTLVLLFILLLDDPMNNRRGISLLGSYPISRLSLFVSQSLGVFGSLGVLAVFLWIPCLFNAVYGGVYLVPIVIGGLFFGIKLILIYGVYRGISEFTAPSLATLITLALYGIAHFDRFFGFVSNQYDGLRGWGAWVIAVIFPPLDQLNRTVLTAYEHSPVEFLGDMLHLSIIVCVGVGGAWITFSRRDLTDRDI